MQPIARLSEHKYAAAAVPRRLALGATMLYHGTSKLRSSPDERRQAFQSMGFQRAARFWATATGLAETFAGAAAVLGIGTRPAALSVLVTQAVAIARVHWPRGFSNPRGGMEFNLSLIALALGLLMTGPGPVSAEHLLEQRVRRRLGGRRLRRVRKPMLLRGLRLLQ